MKCIKDKLILAHKIKLEDFINLFTNYFLPNGIDLSSISLHLNEDWITYNIDESRTRN